MYDLCTLFNSNRFLICPMLEWFHPFKHLMEAIWANRVFRKCFIAPFVHHYYPDSKVICLLDLLSVDS